jgi:hypothetical protein
MPWRDRSMDVRLEVAFASFNKLEHWRLIGCQFSATDRPTDVPFGLKRRPHPSSPNARRDRHWEARLIRRD